MFRISETAIDVAALRETLSDAGCGGYVSFEGWVRDHHEGRSVRGLDYEAYETLAVEEGRRILDEARKRFGVARLACVHRVGTLSVGELAVWVGVSSPHRDEAFQACRYVIDELKQRLPIWKKEHYVEGESAWVDCARCRHAGHDHTHSHEETEARPAAARSR